MNEKLDTNSGQKLGNRWDCLSFKLINEKCKKGNRVVMDRQIQGSYNNNILIFFFIRGTTSYFPIKDLGIMDPKELNCWLEGD